jgi:hypothetical protein
MRRQPCDELTQREGAFARSNEISSCDRSSKKRKTERNAQTHALFLFAILRMLYIERLAPTAEGAPQEILEEV